MDSLPQELIDKIIDDVPQPNPQLSFFDLLSCSLVAKRWRRRSQQRFFEGISVPSEDVLNRWWKNIPQDSDGIPSYVFVFKIEGVAAWDDPALFGRVLKNLTSLKHLFIFRTRIPDELQDPILRGEFGKEIATLYLWSSSCASATTMSMILAFRNLTGLIIGNHKNTSEEPLSTHLVIPQWGPLVLLRLGGDVDEVGKTLVKSRVISPLISLDTHLDATGELIALSSGVLAELILSDTSTGKETFTPIHLSSLPALATLDVNIREDQPSPRLTEILHSFYPVPALSTITIGSEMWNINECPPSIPWVDVDIWLARIAKDAEVKGGVLLTLIRWPEGKSVWEGFLPKFREAGGKIKTDTGGW